MPTLLAALCVLVSPVTLQVRAQPLGTLLPILSAKVGRPLGVQPSLAREQLVIDVKNVDPDALLARIAEVTHAEWVAEGAETRLVRSAEMEKALAADERAFHTANLRRGWEEATKFPYDAQNAAVTSSQTRRDQESGKVSGGPKSSRTPPAERYLSELLLALPPDSVAGLADSRGFVLSNSPRGSQRPFPSGMVPLLGRLLKDQATFSTIFRPSPSDTANVDRVPVRVVMSVSADRPYPGTLRIKSRLALQDERGKGIADCDMWSESPARTKPPAPLPRTTSFLLAAPADELEALRATYQESAGFGESTPRPSPPLLDALINPERSSRLTLTWSDVVFALPSPETPSLVANLPEEAEYLDTHLPEPPSSPKGYLRHLETLETRREDGWITLRSRFPGPAGKARADRALVGQAIRSVVKGRAVSLEEAAALADRSESNLPILLERVRLVDTTRGGATRSLGADAFGLRVLHRLSADLRSALYAGSPIPFRLLPGPVQNTLRDYYLNAGSYQFRVSSTEPDSPDPSEPAPSELDRYEDVTELIGARQIENLTLTADVKETISFLTRAPDSPETRSVMRAEEYLGYFDEDLQVREEVASLFAQLQVVVSRQVTLSIHFPGGFRHMLFFEDDRFDPSAPFRPFAKLPESIREHLRNLKREG